MTPEETTPAPRRAGRMWVTPKAARMLEGNTTTTEDEKLLERPEPSFLDTDPWRALRILGEFVEGFDAMARVEKEFRECTLETLLTEPTESKPLCNALTMPVGPRS